MSSKILSTYYNFTRCESICYDILLVQQNLDSSSMDDLSTVNSRYLEVVGTIFYKFKLPEVQINLHFG